MAMPRLITTRDFTTSRYGELAEQSDVQLSDVLARAEAAIEKRLHRKIAAATYVESYRAKTQTLFVVRRPLISVTSLRRRASALSGWAAVSPSAYVATVGPDYIEVTGVSITGYEVELTYVAGYESVPEDLKEAIIMQSVLFLQTDIEVYGAGDGKEPGIMYMYRDIDRLLEPYCLGSTVYR